MLLLDCVAAAWRLQTRGYGEVRCLEVATITRDAGNAWAPPKTGILVRSVWQQALTGASRNLRLLEAHPGGLHVAAALDTRGALSLWALAPVEPLPLMPAAGSAVQGGSSAFGGAAAGGSSGAAANATAAAAEAMRSLTGPAGLSAVAWLPTMHAACSTSAVAEASASAFLAGGHVVTYLATATASAVHVYAVMLPRLLSGVGRAGHSDLRGWGAVVLGCVAELPLPLSGALPTASLVHKLLCHPLPDSEAAAASALQRSEAVAEFPGAAQQLLPRRQAVQLVATLGSQDWDAGTAAGEASGHAWQQWRLDAALPAPHPHTTEQLLVLSWSVASEQGPNACSEAGHITCCTMAGCASQPLLLAGTSHGMLQVWDVEAGAEQLPAPPPTLLQQLPCTLGDGCSVGMLSSGAPTSPPPGDGDGLGVVTTIAAHRLSGHVAAALSLGPGDVQDAVYLWRQGTGAGAQQAARKRHQAAAPSAAASGGWAAAVSMSMAASQQQAEDRRGRLSRAVLDAQSVAELALEESCGCLAWMSAGGVLPLLAVGLASGEAAAGDRWHPATMEACSWSWLSTTGLQAQCILPHLDTCGYRFVHRSSSWHLMRHCSCLQTCPCKRTHTTDLFLPCPAQEWFLSCPRHTLVTGSPWPSTQPPALGRLRLQLWTTEPWL